MHESFQIPLLAILIVFIFQAAIFKNQSFKKAPLPIQIYSNLEKQHDVEKSERAACPDFAVTARRVGGLGNLMYIYSNLYGFCKKYGCYPIVDNELHRRLRTVFPATSLKPLSAFSHCDFKWKNVSSYPGIASQLSNSSTQNFNMTSFPKNMDYFTNYRDLIRREFQFYSDVQEKVNKEIRKIMETFKTSNIIGFHIRRGDWVHVLEKKQNGKAVGRTYFKAAMQYHKEKRPDAVFAVVSNDIQWCKENLAGLDFRMVFPGKESNAFFDLSLLASCNHSIMTHGSFGFFGGFLTTGEVVYPYNYCTYIHSEVYILQKNKPEGWIPINMHFVPDS